MKLSDEKVRIKNFCHSCGRLVCVRVGLGAWWKTGASRIRMVYAHRTRARSHHSEETWCQQNKLFFAWNSHARQAYVYGCVSVHSTRHCVRGFIGYIENCSKFLNAILYHARARWYTTSCAHWLTHSLHGRTTGRRPNSRCCSVIMLFRWSLSDF